MTEPIPQTVDYRRYAVQQQTISGTLKVSALPRIVAAVHEQPAADDLVMLELAFYEDGQRRVRVKGQIKTTLILQCQRCFEQTSCKIDVCVAGIVVNSDEQAASVPHADEPIMADGDELSITRWVEDEILLSLPMVVRCERDACRQQFKDGQPVIEVGEPVAKQPAKKNPFAVLKDWQRDSN